MLSAEPALRGDYDAVRPTRSATTAIDRLDDSCGGDEDGDPNNVYGDGRIDAKAAVDLVATGGTLAGHRDRRRHRRLIPGRPSRPTTAIASSAPSPTRTATTSSSSRPTRTCVSRERLRLCAGDRLRRHDRDRPHHRPGLRSSTPCPGSRSPATSGVRGWLAHRRRQRPRDRHTRAARHDRRGRRLLARAADRRLHADGVGGRLHRAGLGRRHLVDENITQDFALFRKLDDFGHGCRPIAVRLGRRDGPDGAVRRRVRRPPRPAVRLRVLRRDLLRGVAGRQRLRQLPRPRPVQLLPGRHPVRGPPNAAIYPLWQDLASTPASHRLSRPSAPARTGPSSSSSPRCRSSARRPTSPSRSSCGRTAGSTSCTATTRPTPVTAAMPASASRTPRATTPSSSRSSRVSSTRTRPTATSTSRAASSTAPSPTPTTASRSPARRSPPTQVDGPPRPTATAITRSGCGPGSYQLRPVRELRHRAQPGHRRRRRRRHARLRPRRVGRERRADRGQRHGRLRRHGRRRRHPDEQRHRAAHLGSEGARPGRHAPDLPPASITAIRPATWGRTRRRPASRDRHRRHDARARWWLRHPEPDHHRPGR